MEKNRKDLKYVYESFIKYKSGKLKPNTLRLYRGYWKNYIVGLGTIDVTSNKRSAVVTALSKAPDVSRNRICAFLSSLYSYAENIEGIEGVLNPTRGIEKSKEIPRKRYVLPGEWKSISDGLRALAKGNIDERSFALFVQMMIFTGMRKGEAEGCRWENIDWGRGCILIVDTKTGDREVPLPSNLLELLRSTISLGGFIFPAKRTDTKGRNFSYRWTKWMKELGIEGLTRHDLRRSFGVTALNNGLSIEEVAALLGHSSISTTQRSYAWLSTTSKRKAAEIVSTTLKKNLAL